MKKFRKVLSMFLVIAMAMSLCSATFAADMGIDVDVDVEKMGVTSNKYFDSLKTAYEEYSKSAYLQGKFVTLSLEDFVASYSEKQSVEEYLSDEETKLQGNISLQEVYTEVAQMKERAILENTEESGVMQRSSGSPAWYYNCPELPTDNAYENYPKLLDDTIASGDVVIDQEGLFGLTGHIAIVVGHFYSYIFQSYYVRVVEAVAGGVSYGILCDQRVDERDSYVYRVSTTTAKRSAAVSWAKSQVGKPYRISFSDYAQEDISTSRPDWYCSLLCYAAYKSQYIDLGTKNGDTVLFPRNLIASPYMYERSIR